MTKTYEEINEKIRSGEAVVLTAEEVIDLVKEKGVEKAADGLRGIGLSPEVKLYPGMRHEILNETDHAQVYDDIAAWLEQRIG